MRKPSSIFVGFDGFVDTLFHCVSTRTSPQSFIPIPRISDFATIIQKAAGKSTNVECVALLQDLGGNAPLLARALISLQQKVTLAGCCGYPDLHPLFSELKENASALHSFSNPGRTDALEFSDGKLFLGKMGELHSLTLETMLDRRPLILSAIKSASCIATVNWTMMPLVEAFWEYLLDHPRLLSNSPTLFVDLANPAKRPPQDLKRALSLLTKLNLLSPVILGLNLSESEQIKDLLHIRSKKSLGKAAEDLQKKLSLSTIVIHSPKKTAAASLEGVESLDVPWTDRPFRSTGAGDTFNAGFLSALVQKKSLKNCLQNAVAASGTFVRTGLPPTLEATANFQKDFLLN